MARQRTFDEPADMTEEPTAVPAGPTPGTVSVENLEAHEIDLHLTDGTTIPLGPKLGGQNIATDIAKKLLPPYVRRLAAQGKLRITDLGR